MKKILFLSGSQRRDSHNQRLLKNLAKRLEHILSVDTVEQGQINLPLFDQDLENDPVLRLQVKNLHSRISACDAMIVACPEYNGLITPYLKNTIDWVSRLQYIDENCSNAFIDKPVLLVSASTGWSGGAVGLPSARTLFGYIGCHVLGGAISIPNIQQYLIGSELNFDQNYENLIAFHLQRFKELLAPKTLVNTGFLKG